MSIAASLERLTLDEPFDETALIAHQGLWHSFEHHGRFSHPDKQAAMHGITQAFWAAKSFLKNTNRLIVTLGTAHVFVLKKTGEIVANCHKFPASEFDRRRLSVSEVVRALSHGFEKLKAEIPALEIIATLSPVRHLRDGLSENQRSKATLLLALDEVGQQLPYVHYFPAYELLLDDLRDYRFYAEDMAHPSPLATDYIWQYFEAAFFEDKTKALCVRLEQLLTALAHRPFHPRSEAHQHFLKIQREQLRQLSVDFPYLDFGPELERTEHN